MKMKDELKISIRKSLETLETLVPEDDIPKFDFSNLNQYEEKELKAIDKFLSTSLKSLSEFYNGHAELLEKFQEDSQVLAEDIQESGSNYESGKKITEIRKQIKK